MKLYIITLSDSKTFVDVVSSQEALQNKIFLLNDIGIQCTIFEKDMPELYSLEEMNTNYCVGFKDGYEAYENSDPNIYWTEPPDELNFN